MVILEEAKKQFQGDGKLNVQLLDQVCFAYLKYFVRSLQHMVTGKVTGNGLLNSVDAVCV